MDKAGSTLVKEVEKLPSKIDTAVNKAKDFAVKVYDDKDNIYDLNPTNYDKKIKKIAESPEWKAIVESNDPEYVKKNADGSTSYLIDDYLAKKKQPLLDVLDDIISERPITVNKIDKDAIVSGIKSKIFSTVSMGILATGVVTKFLIEKSKVSQGSYNEQIDRLTESIANGEKYLNDVVGVSKNVTSLVNDDNVQETLKLLQNTEKVSEVKETAKNVGGVAKDINDVKQNINEDKIIEAAKIIMNSDNMAETISSNDVYKYAESKLSNLTEDEIALLNVLLSNIIKR